MINAVADKDMLIEQARLLGKRGFRPGFDNMMPQAAELWIAINAEKLKVVYALTCLTS